MVFESFNKDNIPDGVRRRILATGTAEEMMELENKLLNNRKESKWERYYNVIANFPQDMWEDPEYRKMKSKKASEQWKDPEFREMKSKQVSEKWKDPEFHEMQSKKMSEWNKKQWKDPEYRKMQAKKLNKKAVCNVCGVVSNRGNITRWHNDNCKHKKIENKQ
jgi:alpha-galactosidase/6-phospho-beta-glucosidase family protein